MFKGTMRRFTGIFMAAALIMSSPGMAECFAEEVAETAVITEDGSGSDASGEIRPEISEEKEPEILNADNKCGDNITWKVVQTGAGQAITHTLTLTGSGEMYDYASFKDTPWYSAYRDIHVVKVGEGITYTGSYAFCQGYSVSLPTTLKTIGNHTFADNKNLKNLYIPGSVRTIGVGAFEGCTKLEGVSLWGSSAGDRVEIKSNAFKSSGIKYFTFPKYLEKFGSNAFQDTSRIILYYPEGGIYYNGSYYSEDVTQIG